MASSLHSRVTRARLPPLLLIAGYAMLLASWAMANPPFAAPDEANHYLRTIGLSEGELVAPRTKYHDPGLNAKQNAFTQRTATLVTVPAGLAPDSYGCTANRATESAACLDGAAAPAEQVRRPSSVGTYTPLPYLLPAAVMQNGSDPASADRWARAVSALLVLAFLAAAVLALWDREAGPLSLLGLAAGVTPMVLFCGSILNGSGLEIASGVAFAAALLRVARPGDPPRGAWALLGVGGFVLAVSRSLGPQWILLSAVMVVVLVGRRDAWARVRRAGVTAGAALGAVVAGIVLNRVWEASYGEGYHVGLGPLPGSLDSLPGGSGRVALDIVGNFGVLDTRLPAPALILGYALMGVLLVLAFQNGSARERRVLAAATAAAAVLPGVEQWVAYRHSGFWVQARYFLPVLVAMPLLYGEVVLRHRRSLSAAWRRRLPPLLLGAAALLQLVAWWVNARRYAVGTDGSLWFPGRAEWSPPGGWALWALVTLAGAAAIAVVGLVRTRAGAAGGRATAPAAPPV